MPLFRIAFLLLPLVLFALPVQGVTVTTVPSPPAADEPFQIRIEGTWRDTCSPKFRSLMVADRVLHVTFDLGSGACLSAVSFFSETVNIPPLDGGSYQFKSRLFDFDGLKPFIESTIEVAGAPSGIASIGPTFDTSGGNRVIVIRGSFPCESEGCPAPQVLFGIRPAAGVERISESEIHAVVPPQTNIRYVSVTVKGNSYTHVRPSGFTYILREEYERVLLPFVTAQPLPGAHGSVWETEFRLLNRAGIAMDPDIDIFHLDPLCIAEGCKGPVPQRKMLAPRFATPLPDVMSPPTVQFYVRKEVAWLFAYELRVRDLSRQAESWGTEIPVVRERDLVGGATLLDVPMKPRFRQLLRVYMPDWNGCCRTVVKFYNPDGAELASRTIDAKRGAGTEGGLVPPPYLRAGSAELNLQPAYAELNLATIPELDGHDTIWLTVTPTAALRVWAMVSVTNDETQQVTLITPQ